MEATQQELVKLNEKHSELKETLNKERSAWAQDKRTLEETIVDITTSESERASREGEIKELEERVKAAEERYNRELVSHADAIKAVDGLRAQITAAQAAARENLAAAETANSKLATSETSWKQQKQTLDKEIAELTSRYVSG